MEAKLVVVGGDSKASEVQLRLPTVVGRGREVSLTLPHPLVSRRHCEILEHNDLLLVRDLGSLNGTFIGKERIEGEAVLRPGELLTIGTVTFRAVYGEDSELSPPDEEEETTAAVAEEQTVSVNKTTVMNVDSSNRTLTGAKPAGKTLAEAAVTEENISDATDIIEDDDVAINDADLEADLEAEENVIEVGEEELFLEEDDDYEDLSPVEVDEVEDVEEVEVEAEVEEVTPKPTPAAAAPTANSCSRPDGQAGCWAHRKLPLPTPHHKPIPPIKQRTTWNPVRKRRIRMTMP